MRGFGWVVWLALERAAWAHGVAHARAWWQEWNLDPPLLLVLAGVLAAYGLGTWRLWRRMGAGRGLGGWQVASFALGWLALLVALVSPLDALSDELAAAHMGQHMLLMMVAAPLMVLGHPALGMLWGLPASWRRHLGLRWLARWRRGSYRVVQPLVAWLAFALALWLWHLPQLYQAALLHPALHVGQHLCFFGTAALYWRVLLDPVGRVRLNRGLGVLYLFTTSVHGTLLGVFMALSPVAWYPAYEGRAHAWGLTALQDQQLAGGLMWMPACALYALAALGILALWLQEEPRVTP